MYQCFGRFVQNFWLVNDSRVCFTWRYIIFVLRNSVVYLDSLEWTGCFVLFGVVFKNMFIHLKNSTNNTSYWSNKVTLFAKHACFFICRISNIYVGGACHEHVYHLWLCFNWVPTIQYMFGTLPGFRREPLWELTCGRNLWIDNIPVAELGLLLMTSLHVWDFARL